MIELLVVVAVIAILAAILFPIFTGARERAKSAQCLSNLGQITRAIRQYADDNGGFWPFSVDFEDRHGADAPVVQQTPYLWHVMKPYVRDSKMWKCPGDRGITWQENGRFGQAGERVYNCFEQFESSYVTKISNSFWPYAPFTNSAIKPNPLKLDQAPYPSKAICVMDAFQVSLSGPTADNLSARWHRGKEMAVWNVSFFDGHVKMINWQQLRYPDGRPDDEVSLYSAYWSRPEAGVTPL